MTWFRCLVVLSALLVFSALSPISHADPADTTALLAGVHSLTAPGALPGPLVVFGPHAFVVMTAAENDARVPLFAATPAGKGRILAGGHGGFFGADALKNPDNTRFLINAVTWLANRSAGSTSINVGVLAQPAEIVPVLQTAGLHAVVLMPQDLDTRLKTFDVLYLDQATLDGAQNKKYIQTVSRWVQQGGGLIISGPGWGWKEEHPGLSLSHDQSGNQLIMPLGIALADGTVDTTGPDGTYVADASDSMLCQANAALDALKHDADGTAKLTPPQVKQVSAVLSAALSALPAQGKSPGADFVHQVTALFQTPAANAIPTDKKPLTADMTLARLKALYTAQIQDQTPANQIKANPAAASFPGDVPASAPRLKDQTVTVDTTVPDWHSTGLYAAPGEMITVTLPAADADKGLAIRIGAHTDDISGLASWPRDPEITMQQPLTSTTVRVASPYGGPVYVVVPDPCTLGTVPVTISGAVAAPYFIKGKTDLTAWKTIRQAPGPWAELQGDRVILTVPSSVVRNLDDPQALMVYWDQVLDAAADLYAIPHERKRQERYCTDVEISAGYMHSGYPIMTHMDVAPTFVDLTVMRGDDGGKTWGFYHEMGHNHQQSDWTWDGCGEVTNNLFSLYGDETFNDAYRGGDYFHAHPAVTPTERMTRLVKYLAAGAPYAQWTNDPFLALTFFIELRREFGWAPFTQVFKEYETLGPNEHPQTDEDKRDQFMERFSHAIGKNLGPFFQAWGIPTSDAARASIADLPTWMSPELTAAQASAKEASVPGSPASGAPVRVPAYTAYTEPDSDPDGVDISPEHGVTGWVDSKEQIVWYGIINKTGDIQPSLVLRLPDKSVSGLRLTVSALKTRQAPVSLTAQATGAGQDQPVTVAFGNAPIPAPGVYRFALTGISKQSATYGDLDALLLSGPAAETAHFSLATTRGAPSVHLWYQTPKDAQVTWFYNEVTAKADPVASYYMACGFSRGYFGIQVNSPTERRIIFSVWNSGDEPTDPSKVPMEDRVQLLAKGPNVFAGDFGNEGTGGHSHLVYPWITGHTYRFLVSAQPDGTHTVYSGYFYFPEKKKWELIARFRAPKDGGYLKGLYSFNEDFNGANGQHQRYAEFGPQWIKTADGSWHDLTTAKFTCTADGKAERFDRAGGVTDGRFFLANGGFLPTPDIHYGDAFTRPAAAHPPTDIPSEIDSK